MELGNKAVEIIDLDQVAFEKLAKQRAEQFSIEPFNNDRYLTNAERIELNVMHARIIRKHNVAGIDVVDMFQTPAPMTAAQALNAADTQLRALASARTERLWAITAHRLQRVEDSQARIVRRYNERVARINTDASRRGILNSTIVVDRLQTARSERDEALEKGQTAITEIMERFHHDNQVAELVNNDRRAALSARLHTESIRNHLAVLREKSTQKRHALRELVNMERVRLTTPINSQRMIDQEIHDSYLVWLMRHSEQRAFNLVQWDPLFYSNMSRAMWIQLRDNMANRVVQVG
ncbi:MAG: hypothetical protein FWE38_01615 [Firmicutes bacterium]|nr:hypothetical protein [Bacillota bacterium]